MLFFSFLLNIYNNKKCFFHFRKRLLLILANNLNKQLILVDGNFKLDFSEDADLYTVYKYICTI